MINANHTDYEELVSTIMQTLKMNDYLYDDGVLLTTILKHEDVCGFLPTHFLSDKSIFKQKIKFPTSGRDIKSFSDDIRLDEDLMLEALESTKDFSDFKSIYYAIPLSMTQNIGFIDKALTIANKIYVDSESYAYYDYASFLITMLSPSLKIQENMLKYAPLYPCLLRHMDYTLKGNLSFNVKLVEEFRKLDRDINFIAPYVDDGTMYIKEYFENHVNGKVKKLVKGSIDPFVAFEQHQLSKKIKTKTDSTTKLVKI